jgi:FKBP12-rapamycin complex-associated protein
MMKLVERQDIPVPTRKFALQTVAKLSKKINFADYAARIIHPLARVLQQPNVELRAAAMDTLAAMVFQMTTDFLVFVPMINKLIVKHKIQHLHYEMLISTLLKNELLPHEMGAESDKFQDGLDDNVIPTDVSVLKKLPVNEKALVKLLETQRTTSEDWAEWLRRLSVEVLKESPSHALRACANLANVYSPLARDLFNAAFVSCWGGLHIQLQVCSVIFVK